ncbi:crotonase/enoyl-CoA hydratase family protein [Undibacterium terreum]|uniref:Enoyl-CoA hydratase n=1 Tax=Undibacterium terreum TaxID=1224302 RepID=A0A916V089_9BURK|nr:crotonase/enoyl-CoA hydratase family protein [Undibacterium terreum]GGC97729.1 enoyl-CoA hydratase [Undibacterium terreum]
MTDEKIFGALSVALYGAVAVVSLDRAAKRNALNDVTIAELRTFFETLDSGIKAVVIQGSGEHFCAGLDLSEVRGRSAAEAMFHSRSWHHAFERIQFGRVPVISVLKGAVIGGGLELAAATHIRIAETSAFYALPEGQRGLFVGGGGSVRIPRLVGVPCMMDMMLTGRVLDAEEGLRAGISQYLVAPGQGLEKALALAQKIAANAPLTNYGVLHVLPRVVEQSIQDGMVTEALMAAVAQSDPDTQDRLTAFVDFKANKVSPVL